MNAEEIELLLSGLNRTAQVARDIEARQADLTQRELSVARREEDVSARETENDDRSEELNRLEKTVKDRELWVNNYLLRVQNRSEEVNAEESRLEDLRIQLETEKKILDEKAYKAAELEQLAAIKSNWEEKIAELNLEIKAKMMRSELLQGHLLSLKNQLAEKASSIDEMEKTLEKVKLLAVAKSEALKISAEVKELIYDAKDSADKRLGHLETSKQLQNLKMLTNEVAEFVEKMATKKIQIDILEGHLLVLNQAHENQLMKMKEVSAQQEREKLELQRREEHLETQLNILNVGIRQLSKDKSNWRLEIEEEVEEERERFFANMIKDLKRVVDSIKTCALNNV